ncbi:MAG: hypothetical protein M3422_27435 [Actinomycetota bacterium]|nr:hypothetical protein [Actinomycetota bacterium]
MTASDEATSGDTAHLLRVVGDGERTAGPACLVTETLAVTVPAVTGTASRVVVEAVPGGPDQRVEAVVVTGAEPGIVLLDLVERLPGTAPARFVETRPAWGQRVESLGFPGRIGTGVWARPTLRATDASGGIQLDPEPGGYPLGDGFVGAVVRDATGGVLGMIGDRAGTLIPTRTLLGAVARLAGRPELADLGRPRSPFPGLAAYGEADGAVFHARRAESAAVVELLRDHRRVSVVGDSGCGKSSLIHAGVVPVLRAQGYAISVIQGRADGDPLDGIRRALDANAGVRHLVVLDQVEDILATRRGRDLLEFVAAADLPATTRVVLAMRPDTWGTVLGDERYVQLTRSGSVYALSPLDAGGLRSVLTAVEDTTPVGYEDGLVDRVLRDVAPVSTPMPLLSYLLERLWDRCWADSRLADAPFVLTHAAYHSLGGVAGAIGARAEQVWAGLDDEEKALGRGLLRRLVDIPDADAVPVRRAVARSGTDPAQWRVAERLATERLLSIRGDAGREVVEIVHEVLFRQWDRYARWINEDRTFLLWRAGLARDVARWEANDHDDALLPGDSALEEADVWERAYRGDLHDGERGYLTAGRAARRRRVLARRWRRGGLGTIVAVVVVLATLGAFGLVEARENTAIADSHALVRAAQDLRAADPPLAVMTALAAHQVAPTRESRNQLMRMYSEFADVDRLVSAASDETRQDRSSDGDVVLESSDYAVDVVTGVLSGPVTRHRIPTTEPVWSATLAANGRRAVVFHDDGSGFWFDIDPARGAPIGPMRKLPGPGVPRTRPEDAEAVDLVDVSTSMEELWGWHVNVDPAISADGRHVAARVWGRIVVWDLTAGDGGVVTHRLPALDRMRWELWFGQESRTLIAQVAHGRNQDGTSRLVSIDLKTGRTRNATPVYLQVAVAADGSMAVTCRKQGDSVLVERYRTADGTRAGGGPTTGLTGCPSSLPVDSSARFVYVESVLADFDRRKVVARPGISVSGDHLLERDGTLYGTAAVGGARAYVEIPRAGENYQDASWSALSTDGTRIYVVLRDGRLVARSLEAETYGDELAAAERLKPYWDFEGSDNIQFDAGGTRLLERAGRDLVAVRDARTLELVTTIKTRPPRTFEPRPDPIGGVADPGPTVIAPATSDFTYHFDGRDVVTISDTLLQRWNGNTGKEISRLDITRYRPEADKSDMHAGPGPRPGTAVVYAIGQPGISVVDLASGRVIETIDTPDTIGVQFDPSGRYMALLRSGSILELWRLDPLTREIGPLPSIVDSSKVPFVAKFAGDDGRFLLGTRNTLSVYGIEEGGLVDSYQFGDPATDEGNGAFMGVTKSLNQVIRIDPSGSGGPMSLDPEEWRKHLCKIIGGRDFTDEELAALPGDLERGQICT